LATSVAIDNLSKFWYNDLMNTKEFTIKIEELAKQKNLKYIDAIVHFCENNEIDVGTVGPLISKNLKDKIALEAQDLNYLPKTGRLPGV